MMNANSSLPVKNTNKLMNKYMHLQSIFIQNSLNIISSNDNLAFINSNLKNPSDYIEKILEKKDYNSILVLREALEMFRESSTPNIIDTNLFLQDLSVNIILQYLF